MRNKYIAIIAFVLTTMFGLSVSPESVRFIIDAVLPSTEAATLVSSKPDTMLSSPLQSPDAQTSVGALRPPSAYFKADRACYYCHGFHESMSGISRTVRLAVLASKPNNASA